MIKNIFSLIGAISVTGCANTVWVHEKSTTSEQKTSSTDGIPFYVKVEKFEQNTKWSLTWIEATLKVDKTYLSEEAKGKYPTITQIFTKLLSRNQLSQLSDLKKEILALSQGNDETAKKIIDQFIAVPGLVDTDNTGAVLISNTLKSTWVVDGSKIYYLNAPLPWFGTNTLSHELNGDGTLLKASSAPDTKLAEGISNLIPLKEYLTGKFVTPLTQESDESVSSTLSIMSKIEPTFSAAQAKAKKDTSSFIYQISINLEEKGYVYAFSKLFDTKPDSTTPIQFDTINGLFVREPVATQNADSKKDADVKSIEFQGAITLPKDDAKQ